MNTLPPLLFLFSSLTTVSIANPKTLHSPPKRPLKEFIGRIESGLMAIGGESTGTQIVLENSQKIEIQVPSTIDISKFPGSVKIKGKLKKIKSVERGSREVLEVTSIEPASQ